MRPNDRLQPRRRKAKGKVRKRGVVGRGQRVGRNIRGWRARLVNNGLLARFKWATFCQGLAEFGFEVQICGIWLRANRIQCLAEEVARCSG